MFMSSIGVIKILSKVFVVVLFQVVGLCSPIDTPTLQAFAIAFG